jgi:transcriptional regulator GlxA family with amidase domain
VAATLDVLTAENASDAPGSRAVVNRLSDLFLAQALRVTLTEIASGDTAPLRGFRDPQIAAAIGLIHHNPERPWTVGRLASEVALSRSAFAARFQRLLGESPKSYVTRTRLVQAASMLRGTHLPLPEVVVRAGYASQFSFSKAFKRAFGLSPGAYRSQEPDVADPGERTRKIAPLAPGRSVHDRGRIGS